MVSLKQVRERLELRAQGRLSQQEEAALQRDARILKRRLDKLHALSPALFGAIELSEELDELASPPVLTASS